MDPCLLVFARHCATSGTPEIARKWPDDSPTGPVLKQRDFRRASECWNGGKLQSVWMCLATPPKDRNWQHPNLKNEWEKYGAFLSHRGTPSHHPFIDGMFPEINHPFGGTPSYGKPHITLNCIDVAEPRSGRRCKTSIHLGWPWEFQKISPWGFLLGKAPKERIPIGSMVLEYLPTFALKISPM